MLLGGWMAYLQRCNRLYQRLAVAGGFANSPSNISVIGPMVAVDSDPVGLVGFGGSIWRIGESKVVASEVVRLPCIR